MARSPALPANPSGTAVTPRPRGTRPASCLGLGHSRETANATHRPPPMAGRVWASKTGTAVGQLDGDDREEDFAGTARLSRHRRGTCPSGPAVCPITRLVRAGGAFAA